MQTESVTKNIGLKMNKISESGIIGPDGKLRMPMDRLNAFFALNKGKRILVQFEAYIPGTTEAQKGYYYNYVLPCIASAYRETGERMTEQWADRKLIREYPGELCVENGERAIYAHQLNQVQMSDFLDWLKQFAAENLYVYIEDPRTL